PLGRIDRLRLVVSSTFRPLPAIGRPLDRSQMDAVFLRIPGRAPGDDEMIARLERLDRETGLLEPRGIGPFGGKFLCVSVRVDDREVQPGVWVLELEGDDVAFD